MEQKRRKILIEQERNVGTGLLSHKIVHWFSILFEVATFEFKSDFEVEGRYAYFGNLRELAESKNCFEMSFQMERQMDGRTDTERKIDVEEGLELELLKHEESQLGIEKEIVFEDMMECFFAKE